ncbi:MAG: hypothetical protein KTR22_03985 [Flavobacteriaceae bacterium]|nr:hypothetical protein [Flavobacteriaceae bacterium]
MKRTVFLFIALCLLVSIPAEAQCAMCRAVLETEESGNAAKGINDGIAYLMLFPYLLIGTVGYVIYRMRKKAHQEEN